LASLGCRRWILAVALFSIALGSAAVSSASPEFSSALRTESWEALAEDLESGPRDSLADQFLLGHAYLALNRNNESVCMFLLAESESGRVAWGRWTTQFVRQHGDHPVAHYLRGDASARLSNWEEAVSSFDRALQIDPDHHLSMNAKAVALAGSGQWNRALVLLSELIALDPDFADPYGSRGTINVKRSQAPEGAIRWFDKALQIVPDFSLALNGRGSVHVALGNWEAAKADLEEARDASACTLVATENLIALELGRVEELARRGDLADSEAGTSMLRSIRTPADQRLSGLQSAHNRAMIAGVGRDMTTAIPDRFTSGALRNTLENYRIDRLNQARDISNSINRDAFTAVRTNMINYPDGPAARAWRARGIEVRNFDLGVFNNPPPRLNSPGGVDMSMRGAYVDTGRWSVDTWFGLGYEVPAEHLEAGSSNPVPSPK